METSFKGYALAVNSNNVIVSTKPVMAVFKFKDTYGLPFEIIALELKEKGILPDWEEFCTEAIKHNWLFDRILKEAEELAVPLNLWNSEFVVKLKQQIIKSYEMIYEVE